MYGAQGRCLGELEYLAACFISVAEWREVQEALARTTGQDRDLYVSGSRTDMGKRRFRCRYGCGVMGEDGACFLYYFCRRNLTDCIANLVIHLRRVVKVITNCGSP